jgi:hypothetical protein
MLQLPQAGRVTNTIVKVSIYNYLVDYPELNISNLSIGAYICELFSDTEKPRIIKLIKNE